MENKQTDMEGYLNLNIGKEQPKLTPMPVQITGMSIEEANDKQGKFIGNKLVLTVKYTQLNRDLNISKVKYLDKNKLRESALWVKKDIDGNLPINSALAHLLIFYKRSNLSDLMQATIDTTYDENGYLIAKAY